MKSKKQKNKLPQTKCSLTLVLSNGHRPPTLWYETTEARDIAFNDYIKNRSISRYKIDNEPWVWVV